MAMAAEDAAPDRVADKLTIAGATTFSIAYVPMSGLGTFAMTQLDFSLAGLSYMPVAGPIVFGAWMNGGSETANHVSAGLLIADGIVQIAGITLMIAGATHKPRRIR